MVVWVSGVCSTGATRTVPEVAEGFSGLLLWEEATAEDGEDE